MRIIETEVYKYDELDEKAKERARDWYKSDMSIEHEMAFETIVDDAREVGIEIHSVGEYRRNNEGELKLSLEDVIKKILENHGSECETYKTAARYQNTLRAIKDTDSEEYENAKHEFLYEILEDFRIIFDKDIEYRYSDSEVAESIIANDYEFTKDGKRA